MDIQVDILVSHILGNLVIVELGQSAPLEFIVIADVLYKLEDSDDLGLLNLELDLYLLRGLGGLQGRYVLGGFELLVLAT